MIVRMIWQIISERLIAIGVVAACFAVFLNWRAALIEKGARKAVSKIEKVEQKEIFFQRVDWQNPQLSFALAQRSYEVRYRHPEYGEVIFSGDVRESQEGTEPPWVYVFSLQEAWRLAAGQKRISVNPSLQ